MKLISVVHWRVSVFMFGLLSVYCLTGARSLAERSQDEDIKPMPSDVMTLMGDLNQVAAWAGFNVVQIQTNSPAAKALNRKSLDVRSDLAARGVCVRYKDGVFVHATREALNGYLLEPDEIRYLARLNYLKQVEQASSASIEGYKGSGETRSQMKTLADHLGRCGISVEWNGELYVVQSVRTNSATPVETTGQETNLAPINASIPFPEK